MERALLRSFGSVQGYGELFGATENGDLNSISRSVQADFFEQIAHAGDSLAIDAYHDVSGLNACFVGRAVDKNTDNERALYIRVTGSHRRSGGDFSAFDTHPAACDFPVFDNLLHDIQSNRRRNCEADARRTAALTEDGSIDSD